MPGRPTKLTAALLKAMAAFIRLDGLSDSYAGLLAGISPSTLSRWKREHEEVEIALGQARAQYELERLRAIKSAVRKDGSVDWRAQAWLLQHSSPETYGSPSRRRQARADRERAEEQARSADEGGSRTAGASACPSATRARGDGGGGQPAGYRATGSQAHSQANDEAATSQGASACSRGHREQAGAPNTGGFQANGPGIVLTPENLERLQAARLRWLARVNGDAGKQPVEGVTKFSETPASSAGWSRTEGTEAHGEVVKA